MYVLAYNITLFYTSTCYSRWLKKEEEPKKLWRNALLLVGRDVTTMDGSLQCLQMENGLLYYGNYVFHNLFSKL